MNHGCWLIQQHILASIELTPWRLPSCWIVFITILLRVFCFFPLLQKYGKNSTINMSKPMVLSFIRYNNNCILLPNDLMISQLIFTKLMKNWYKLRIVLSPNLHVSFKQSNLCFVYRWDMCHVGPIVKE